MLLNCGVGEDSWESHGLQGDPTSPFWRRSALGFLCKEWCWSWNSCTLATSCEELTHWKRLWCWERLGAGGEGDDQGWVGWMASRTWWTWVWMNSGSWWWTGRPGVLRFMGSQKVRHDWATELTDWTDDSAKNQPIVTLIGILWINKTNTLAPKDTHIHVSTDTVQYTEDKDSNLARSEHKPCLYWDFWLTYVGVSVYKCAIFDEKQ